MTQNSIRSHRPSTAHACRGFTLVEMLISVTFLVIVMLVVTQLVGIVQRNWVRANTKVTQFREARMAFDLISKNLSQATLNTYWEMRYQDLGVGALSQKKLTATSYFRQSELQFVSGPTSQLISSQGGGGGVLLPGHAVFFQAPLGVIELTQSTSSTPSSLDQASTQNLVNLLCARGYFVQWGDDIPYRPAFLNSTSVVPVRSRYRLIEYSPSAEKNRIYAQGYRLIDPLDRTKTVNSRKWFQNVLDQTSVVKTGEGEGGASNDKGVTRPVAENILALIISPQIETNNNTNSVLPTSIAPQYLYDSVLERSPGAAAGSSQGNQGTRHLLPPLIKIRMIALDERSGEFLARDENQEFRQSLTQQLSQMFQSADKINSELNLTTENGKIGDLDKLLLSKKINYRVFNTTIALKQSRWSS